MAHPNVEMLRKTYDAFNQGDMETLGTVLADDVVGHVPGRSPLAGDYKGRDEVFGLFGKLAEMTGGNLSVEIHAILADDEHGVVLSLESGEREGKRLDQEPTTEVFHIQDGKVTEFWSYALDQYAEDEFWS